jgi:hypothetical protein
MIPIPLSVKNIPGRTSSAQYEILFRASLPALGFSTYYFEVQHVIMKSKSPIRMTFNEACTFENKVTINNTNDIIYRIVIVSSNQI